MKFKNKTFASIGALAALFCINFAGWSVSNASDGMDINFDEVPAIHFPIGNSVVSAHAAFEDYAYMLFDICEAMQFKIEKECMIYPMNANLGGNALATIVDGNRLIIYDRRLSPIVGGDGAEMIIAHELAHHLCGHLQSTTHLRNELEADAFMGAAAKLMGKSLDHALSVISIMSERPSRTHPAREDRVEAITAGWLDPTNAKACKLLPH